MTLLVDGMGVKIQIAFQANLIEMFKSIKYCITRTDKPTEYLQSKHTETFFKVTNVIWIISTIKHLETISNKDCNKQNRCGLKGLSMVNVKISIKSYIDW